MMFELPKTLEVNGTEYPIETDYRAVLTILTALSDPELQDDEKVFVALHNLYPDFFSIPMSDYMEATKQCFWFINGGDKESSKRSIKLLDWEQDFKFIVAPINRIAGCEVRELPYLHWWSFLGYYYEIGDCIFATIVRIRERRAKGKKLDKQDQEFLKENRELVEFKRHYTAAEEAFFKEWG